jgi:hypothetical protein
MTSDIRWLLAVALVAGCGRGVHDLSIASDPLVVLHGHVDRSRVQRVHPEAPLLGALIWAGVPNINPVCVKFPGTEIQRACPDPYGVFYGEVERAAPVDDDGNFELTLFHLPRAAVSVGDEVTRIAYGSLLVVEDVDGDGQPSFFPPPAGRRDPTAPGPSGDPDTIVAASFHTLHDTQERVVFREGGFVADSNFYPAPGCDPPPPGFSVETVPRYQDTPALPEQCSIRPVDATVPVPPVAAADALALMCRAIGRDPRVREPRIDNQPPPGATYCLGGDILAVVSGDGCGRLTAFTLKGCDHDPFCLSPEWDHTADPPAWWPCH